MASSGSWKFGTSNPYIQGTITWSQKKGTSAQNTSTIHVKLTFSRTNSGYTSWGTMNTYGVVNYQSKNELGYGIIYITENSNTRAYEKDFVVSHNDNGSLSINIHLWGNADFGCNFDTNRTFTCDTIPRYANITSFNINSYSNNAVSFSWSTDANVKQVYCTLNDSILYNATGLNTSSGSFTIGGLSEHTVYRTQLHVVRYDSGLTTGTTGNSFTTNWTTPSSNLWNSSTTLDTITLGWSSNYNCSRIILYITGTSTAVWDQSFSGNTSGGYITLTPNNHSAIYPGNNFSYYLIVYRKDVGNTGQSGVVTATTKGLPYINSIPSFNIGNNTNITVVNNSQIQSFSIIQQLYNSTWINLPTISVGDGNTFTSKSFTTSYDANTLYSNCPNSNSLLLHAVLQIKTAYRTYNSAYYNYYANVVNSNPAINSFDYETNIGTNINEIISGTQNLITGEGNLQLQFPESSATSMNYASISYYESYIIYNNNVITSGNIPYSSTAFNYNYPINNITQAGTYWIKLVAVDSRGNKSDSMMKSILVYKYNPPALGTKNKALVRYNNFESKIFVDLEGLVSNITISSVKKNHIKSFSYCYAESGKEFSELIPITNYDTSYDSNDNVNMIFKKGSNEDSDSYFISLDYDKSYVVKFVLEDLLHSVEYIAYVDQGVPLFAVTDSGKVVIGKIPDLSDDSKLLQVQGDISVTDEDGTIFNILEEIKKVRSILKEEFEYIESSKQEE